MKTSNKHSNVFIVIQDWQLFKLKIVHLQQVLELNAKLSDVNAKNNNYRKANT